MHYSSTDICTVSYIVLVWVCHLFLYTYSVIDQYDLCGVDPYCMYCLDHYTSIVYYMLCLQNVSCKSCKINMKHYKPKLDKTNKIHHEHPWSGITEQTMQNKLMSS